MTFLPRIIAWSLLALAMASIWVGDRLYELAGRGIERIRSRSSIGIFTAILTIVCAVLFIACGSESRILGDSFKLLTQHDIMPGFSPTEQLTVTTVRSLASLFGDVSLAYTIVSVTSGLIFVIIAISFALAVTKSGISRIAILGLFFSLGTIQNFFSYPENYSIALALSTVFLFLGWRVIRRRASIWPAIVVFLISTSFHLLAEFLVPGLIYLLYCYGGQRGRSLFRYAAFAIALAVIVGATAFITKFSGQESLFTPIFSAPNDPYSLFRIQHLADLGNVLLLVAPAALITGIVLKVQYFKDWRSSRSLSPEVLFFIMSSAGSLCLLIFIDPKLGALRDWDLLSLFGIPTVFLASALLVSVGDTKRLAAAIVGCSLAVMLCHTGPWIYSNTSPDRAYQQIKRVIKSDIHYGRDYYKGDRLLSWGLLVWDRFQDSEELERCYAIRTLTVPNDYRAWLYLAHARMDIADSTGAATALAAIPANAAFTLNQRKVFMENCMMVGLYDHAVDIWNFAVKRFKPDLVMVLLRGKMAWQMGDGATAMRMFTESAKVAPQNLDIMVWQTRAAMLLSDLSTADSVNRLTLGMPDPDHVYTSEIDSTRKLLDSLMQNSQNH